jgi:hypothetical protein
MVVAAPQKAKKTKKGRKVGRAAKECQRYRLSNRREHNKLRRLNKHIMKHPEDECAMHAIEVATKVIRGF